MATALTNTVTINGQYDGVAFGPQSANITAQVVTMTVAKTADPMVWIGAGELTYTVTVTNGDADAPLSNLVLTDTLDPVLTAFVVGSVQIGGSPVLPADVTFVEGTGLLTVRVPELPASESVNITFRVTKRPA